MRIFYAYKDTYWYISGYSEMSYTHEPYIYMAGGACGAWHKYRKQIQGNYNIQYGAQKQQQQQQPLYTSLQQNIIWPRYAKYE